MWSKDTNYFSTNLCAVLFCVVTYMETKEANVRPPIPDGTNYEFWKDMIRAHIKAIDEKAWKSVLGQWKPPNRVVNGNKVPKTRGNLVR